VNDVVQATVANIESGQMSTVAAVFSIPRIDDFTASGEGQLRSS